MHLRIVKLVTLAGLVLAACRGAPQATGPGRPASDVGRRAWAAWAQGDVEGALRIAAGADAGDPSADRLMAFGLSVKGDYQGALAHYAQVPAATRDKDLDRVAIEAYRHLGRYEDAAKLGRDRQVDPFLVAELEDQAAHPPRVELAGPAVVPFVDDSLGPFMPGVAAEVNGQAVTARFDSGGTFLVMSPAVARGLGIALSCGGKGSHAFVETDVCFGRAELRLGAATLHDAPVTTVASLEAANFTQVIFGTSVAEQFFTTLDYPGQRLLLSPRGDAALAERQLAGLAGARVTVPFYLWADHFLFARGAVDAHHDADLFIDSGLVAVTAGSDGKPRQAALHAPTAVLAAWGLLAAAPTAPGYLPGDVTLALGPLTQTGHLAYYTPALDHLDFGGLPIAGILSHAFLSRYAWTLDFDRRVFIFTVPAGARDMGTWDCSGAAAQEVTVPPGQQVYVWHGRCGGEEGVAIEVKPKVEGGDMSALDVRQDAGLDGTLTLRLDNRGSAPMVVLLSVFVGFA